jgi:hypothetical protein
LYAVQLAVLVPFAQFQLYIPSAAVLSVRDVVHGAQRLDDGALDVVVPSDVPHTAVLYAEQLTELVPFVQLQLYIPSAAVLSVRDVVHGAQRFDDGALDVVVPSDVPHTAVLYAEQFATLDPFVQFQLYIPSAAVISTSVFVVQVAQKLDHG